VFPYLGFASNSSCASFGSRVSRTTSISWPEATEPLWRTTFRIFTLRLRAVASLLLALERRRIAHPRLRTTRVSRWDYSRDLRQAKWGSGISLHGGNPEPLMSALGQKQTSARRSLMTLYPQSGHYRVTVGCPLCARSGHRLDVFTPASGPKRSMRGTSSS
jgi:hypothetical protein